jgi:hypothetical protein
MDNPPATEGERDKNRTCGENGDGDDGEKATQR